MELTATKFAVLEAIGKLEANYQGPAFSHSHIVDIIDPKVRSGFKSGSAAAHFGHLRQMGYIDGYGRHYFGLTDTGRHILGLVPQT